MRHDFAKGSSRGSCGQPFMLGNGPFAAEDTNLEKCYGVTKAGKNDCADGAHAFAGQSTKDKCTL